MISLSSTSLSSITSLSTTRLSSTSLSTTSPVSTASSTSTATGPPPETLTVLPTGVSFQTLTGVTYTSPTYITTTSPGSDQPTIVPIIIPFVGPPQICFGCIVKFPPNIKIDIPEFCIQLFGLKIGNCPPKGNKDGKDNGNDDDKKDDNKDDKDDDDEKKSKTRKSRTKTHSSTATTTTSSSSSSCTATVTATHMSVFCSVTRGNTADAAECSTSAYTTVKECSALASAATVTTTHTALPSAVLCGPRSCGSGSCAVKNTKIKRSEKEDSAAHQDQDRNLVRRGDPSLGKWPDPSEHETHQGFVVSQIDAIAEDRAKRARYAPKLVRFAPIDGPSASWVTFKDDVEAIGLEGLFGCTSIVLVSRKGAWVGHIWQTTMDPEGEENEEDEDGSSMDPFENLLEQELPYRIPPDEEFHQFYEYGLEDMKNHPEDGDAGVMFGNDRDGADETTPGSLHMRAFIVTPRNWGYPDVYHDARGRPIPHQVLAHADFRKGTVKYPAQVGALRAAVAGVYGDDVPVEVIDYNPTVVRPEHWAAFDQTGMLVVNGELMPIPEYHGRLSRGTVRGKILLQYQPAATCRDEAEWRLWVEGQPVGDRTDKWTPLAGQVFSSPSGTEQQQPDKSSDPADDGKDDPVDKKSPADKKVERRQQVCELPDDKSKATATVTATSVGASASPSGSLGGGSSTRAGLDVVTLSTNGSVASRTLTSVGTGFLPRSTTPVLPGGPYEHNSSSSTTTWISGVSSSILSPTTLMAPTTSPVLPGSINGSSSSTQTSLGNNFSKNITLYSSSASSFFSISSPSSSSSSLQTNTSVITFTTTPSTSLGTTVSKNATSFPSSSQSTTSITTKPSSTSIFFTRGPFGRSSSPSSTHHATTKSSQPPPSPTTITKPTTTSKDTLVVIPIKDNKPTTTTTTSKKKKPVPAPSEAAIIFYTEIIAPVKRTNRLVREGAWYMLAVGAGDADTYDPCDKYPMGYLPLKAPLDLDRVAWPPQMTGERPFFDHRRCEYKPPGGSGFFGTMSCDNVPLFECEVDPRANSLIECAPHPKAEQSFKPRIVCRFPVQ
ncbi:hypothetical protein CTA2_3798 [Colletotrichum tanaceti]|uniref:Uncharacterized protein n=1 Tax=Colletotrichum tanaceti TaxID=1306861 RepID=A0A4U6X0E8_9PEZI|nr:hypothetical protein CTA2_3798 [Colletotrichum tanaceti]TKW48838.1 hypothetical protein CTA1_1377 [Colletotrichum tanaceti]